jgi:putative iron-dependent peroxidase
MFAGPRPAGLHPFRELVGPVHRAPATAGDLFFHLRATETHPCFELACHIVAALGAAATVCDEVHGFRYFDARDLLGFVDGTENPEGPAAGAAALIGAEDPDFAGGSYVIAQKYLHDLGAWSALPVEAQENVIGRTKLSNIELDDTVQPDNSHVALNTITDAGGAQLRILRDNMPFGSVGRGEFGTYFIGYARTPAVTEHMLRNMFLGNPPGNYDRILDFSTATTGCLFFVPAAGFFDDLPSLPDPPGRAGRSGSSGPPAPPTASASPAVAPPADGSLGIGDPKRSAVP